MELEALYEFYRDLQQDSLSLAYQGEFSDDMTEKLISLSEYNIENIQELKKSKKKVSFLIAESFQNIVRHSDEIDIHDIAHSKIGVFITRNIGNSYYITSANLVDNKNIDTLRSNLMRVNSLTPDELKVMYMQILENESLSDKGGAGLGLIEMARKSGQKLDFAFENMSDKLSYFYLQIKIAHGVLEEATKPLNETISIANARRFRQRMSDNDILMIYKGDFSEDSIMPVLKMIKENMERNSEEFVTKKRVYLVLVEVLQNISKHSKRSPDKSVQIGGILMVSKFGAQYSISTGNLIEKKDMELLKSKLDYINTLNRTELGELYTKILADGEMSEKGGAGLGLVDIAKKSSEKLLFNFTPVDDPTTLFFGINSKIGVGSV